MTDWRKKLAERRQPNEKGPGDSLPKLTKPPVESAGEGFVGFVTSPDDHLPPETDPDAIRAKLAELASVEGVAPELVTQLAPADVAACAGLPTETLRAYVRELETTDRIAHGSVPRGWDTPAACAGCGPVWLWEGIASPVLGCPWCARRKAGQAIPRPPVTCETCRHYIADLLNPPAGIGRCAAWGKPAHYPMRPHMCPTHRAKGGGNES
jgi:hypothetical protein